MRGVTTEVHALYLAVKDERVPWYAKVVALVVVAYALSPIDLIPDFIPIVGYLDDLVIVPLGIFVAVKLVPPGLMSEFRVKANDALCERRLARWGAALILAVWGVGLAVAMILLHRRVAR